jgi:hypothetical protein
MSADSSLFSTLAAAPRAVDANRLLCPVKRAEILRSGRRACQTALLIPAPRGSGDQILVIGGGIAI